MTGAQPRTRLRRVLRIVRNTLGVLGLTVLAAILADLVPNLWRHLRFHSVVGEPWDEITTDAVLLDDHRALAFQGTTLSVFEGDGHGAFRPVESLATGQFLHRLLVHPPWGFSTAGDKGMAVLDLKNVTKPRVVGYLAPQSDRDHLVYGYDMAVHGGRALVAARAGGFFLVDVSDASHPKLIGRQHTPGVGQGAAIDDRSGWVSVGGHGVIEIDLASGAALTSRRIAEVPADSSGLPEPPPFDVAVRRPYVYFGMGRWGLGVARTDGVAVPPNLVPLPGQVQIRGVSVDGDLLCVADYASGVFLIDVKNPEQPVVVNHVPTPGTPVHVSCQDGKMVVTRGARGFAAYDIADLAAPRLVGEFDPQGFSHFVELFGDHAAVARGSAGVDIYALADDGTPTRMANIPSRGTAQNVIVRDRLAYVSEVTGGLTVWDVSDPAHPRFSELFEIEQHVRRVESLGDRLVTVGGEGPVSVLARDATGRLERTQHFDRLGYAWRSVRAGGVVWVGALHHGVGFVQLTADGTPQWRDIGGIRDGVEEPLALAADGGILYAADLGAVAAIDVSNASDPQVLGRRLRLGITYPVGLAVDGNRLYVAVHRKGLWIVELEERRPVRVLARCATKQPLMAVAARGGHVWIAPGSEPLRRLDVATECEEG